MLKEGGISLAIISKYICSFCCHNSYSIGVGKCIYMSEYASNQSYQIHCDSDQSHWLQSPSIVFGLFGLAFLLYFEIRWCILSGGLVFTLMHIPTISKVKVILSSIPNSYKEGERRIRCYKMAGYFTQLFCLHYLLE